jgi:hypothetical protein
VEADVDLSYFDWSIVIFRALFKVFPNQGLPDLFILVVTLIMFVIPARIRWHPASHAISWGYIAVTCYRRH